MDSQVRQNSASGLGERVTVRKAKIRKADKITLLSLSGGAPIQETDLQYIEENGCIDGCEPAKVSPRAWERGREQLGTLGSGNHFLEVGYVAEIYDTEAARALGLFPDQITVIIHCGSRGFGYQICDDYLAVMDRAASKFKIELPDRQLACAPVNSEEGQSYLGAMRCAINYAFANRQIIADERTNSLLIFASRTDMETIKKIISQLDVVLAQVLIETVIIEYTLGPDTRNVGFSYVQSPRNLAGNIAGEGAGGAGQFLNRGFTAISGGTNSSGGLTGGFNYLLSFGQDLDVTVSAIEASSKGKVLQRPRIQTSHAVPAQIFVGESRPYPQGSYYGGGSFGGYSTIQQLQIGVTLEVTPLINPDGLVVMDIHQTIENYAGFTDITGVGQVPITTRKEASAKVAVRDRDTIMLGGLIETDKSKSHSGVPFLMDIPLLGYLFRSTSTSDTRKELIVLIRPSVLPTPEVAALTARSEKEKMAGVRETEREIMEENAARLRDADKHLK